MFDRSTQTRHKTEIRVRIRLAGDEAFEASVFLKVDERLLDLLNDARAFLPMRRMDGTTVIVAKSNIVSIEETAIAANGDRTVLKGSCEKEKKARIGDAAEPWPDPASETEQAPPPEPPPSAGANPGEEQHSDEAARRGSQPKRPPRQRRVIDPYEILRVDRDASLEEVKRAYKARIKAVHPDTLAGLDLDEDLARAAHMTAQRVNQAYDRILREKFAEGHPGSNSPEASDDDGPPETAYRETDAA